MFSSMFEHLAPRPPKPPVASTSKAGRNLKQAVPVAVGLLALVALSVMWHIEIFVCLVTLALCMGMWEAAGAYMNKLLHLPLLALWVAVLMMVASAWFGGVFAAFVALGASLVLVVACAVISGSSSWRDDAKAAALCTVWIGYLGSFAVLLAGVPRGALMIAMLVAMPAASDTGGWLFGVLWGKHPMSPRISPKKSWEGFSGSLVVAVAVACAFGMLALDLAPATCLLIGVCAVVCSAVGDLSESVIKRRLGVKDMGSIFPGHGGILDRIDSILMWAPVCYMIMVSPLAA